MPERLVVVFFPQSTKEDSKPHPVMLARCKPSTPEELEMKCREKIHPYLLHPSRRGKILLAPESDPRTKSQDPDEVHDAHEWLGTDKSGPFSQFLVRHAVQFFPQQTA